MSLYVGRSEYFMVQREEWLLFVLSKVTKIQVKRNFGDCGEKIHCLNDVHRPF